MSLHYTLSLKKADSLNVESKTSWNGIQQKIAPGLSSERGYDGEQDRRDIIQWLSDNLQQILSLDIDIPWSELEEIRLRIGQPLLVRYLDRELFVGYEGAVVSRCEAYRVTREDLVQTLERMTQSSFYATEEELKQGFLTLPGGHRVGITGQAVLRERQLQTLKHISALNIRLAREIRGKVLEVLPFLLHSDGSFRHTMILAAPRAGKTTLLRRLIRSLSDGDPRFKLQGQVVGVVDERGELAGMWQGIPTYDLGCRTDVLDGCPKSIGIGMLVRAMAPDIIAVDELGHPDDVTAIADALRTGVKILSTAHAGTWEEARKRPSLRMLFEQQVFERVVIMSRRSGPGTIEGIYDPETGSNLLSSKTEI